MTGGLASLIAKQKEPSDGQTGTPDAPKANPFGTATPDASADSTESVPRESETPASVLPKLGNPFGGQPDSGPPVDGAGVDSGGGSNSGDSESRPKLAGLSLGTKPPAESLDAGAMAGKPLDSLDAIDQSTDTGVAPREGMSSFEDETPATKPTRELPEGLSKEELSFMDMVDGVYEVLHEPDMLGGVIRNIIMELGKNPEYMRLVAPDDIRTWVRGMRDSMGLARIKKTESKAKRSGGAGAKSKLVDADMLADLDALGIGGLEA